ncbi:MAG: threonylcarbamoyl-AMP synthase [Bdellovibrionales bacterium]|nr:threonylcarbamoyl-AMP synthase [Bdellovibrionales bacterium]
MSIDQDIQAARALLRKGEVVAMPTETVYGLAAPIDNESGLKRIFAVKERPLFDPLIVHVADIRDAMKVVRSWPAAAAALAKKFWPGPLTLVLPKAAGVNSLITAGLDTVGVRMPAHPVAQKLIRATGCPLAAPSANKFGKTSPTKAEHVRKSFPEIFIVDGGPSEVGLESTVVEVREGPSGTGLFLLRPGAVTKEMIEAALVEAGISISVDRLTSSASPGHTENHYMPVIPLVIVDGAMRLSESLRARIIDDFQLSTGSIGTELKLDSNPKLAARSLYAKMRDASDTGSEFIWVVRRKENSGGLWEAIWDRLERAASKTYPAPP